MSRITFDDNKYTVVNELNEGGGFKALRYGEERRNLAGDNLVLAMYQEIEELQEEVKMLKEDLKTEREIANDKIKDAYWQGVSDFD